MYNTYTHLICIMLQFWQHFPATVHMGYRIYKIKSTFFSTSLFLAGNLGCLTWVKHSSHKSGATHSYCCVQCFCVQTMVWLPVIPVFGIFNMRTDVDACDCTKRLYRHHKRACTGRWVWAKNPQIPWRTGDLKPVLVVHQAFQLDAHIYKYANGT